MIEQGLDQLRRMTNLGEQHKRGVGFNHRKGFFWLIQTINGRDGAQIGMRTFHVVALDCFIQWIRFLARKGVSNITRDGTG